MNRTRLSALCVFITVAGALFAALLRILTVFNPYDDEGYMLLSLSHYISEGHLYTQTFSQYGPFYFYAQGIFFQLLHLPVTHDMGRLVTLFYWLASGVLAAVFVYRFSKNCLLGFAAGVFALLAGRVLADEPGHPQQVLLFLFMLAACLSLPSPRLFLLGCVGAALMFTKLNAGVFYIAALAHTVVCLLPASKMRSLGLVLTLLYAASAPWLLMHSNFNHGFLGYCLLATLGGIVTFSYSALLKPRESLPVRGSLLMVAGLVGGVACIVVATSLQGMSLDTLVSGVILNPLRQPNVFHIPLNVGWGDWLAAVILIMIVVTESRLMDVFRCVAGVGAILLLTSRYQIQLVLPLLPLTLTPRARWEVDTGTPFARLFITLLAATQFLQPYPVAGSQVGIAAAPMLLWSFLCISDGIAGLKKSFSRPLDIAIGRAVLVLSVALAIAFSIHWGIGAAHAGSTSARLKGSEWLHLPAAQAIQFESIAHNVGTNCSMLFTMPGMGSFNMWSGVPTPNGSNLTAWMKGISSEKQVEILEILQANSQACAILNRRMVHFWDADDAAVATLPLARYITTDMPMISAFGDYEIHVHPRRNSPWR